MTLWACQKFFKWPLCVCVVLFTVGQKIKKKFRPKKLVKSNNSISRKFFLTKFHFLLFQKLPKSNFWTRKKFKKKCNFTEIFLFIYLISQVFFCLDFFKFSDSLYYYVHYTFSDGGIKLSFKSRQKMMYEMKFNYSNNDYK